MNEQFACKVCNNTPNEQGVLEHGRGCYTQSADGGGQEYIEEADWCGKIGMFTATLRRMLEDKYGITNEMRVEVWQRIQAGYCPVCGSGSPCDCKKAFASELERALEKKIYDICQSRPPDSSLS